GAAVCATIHPCMSRMRPAHADDCLLYNYRVFRAFGILLCSSNKVPLQLFPEFPHKYPSLSCTCRLPFDTVMPTSLPRAVSHQHDVENQLTLSLSTSIPLQEGKAGGRARGSTLGEGEEGLRGAIAGGARGAGRGTAEGFGEVPVERGSNDVAGEAKRHHRQDDSHKRWVHSTSATATAAADDDDEAPGHLLFRTHSR
ncbi:unnamed protein product, partial [Musa acuminata subsp. burmannicoides]